MNENQPEKPQSISLTIPKELARITQEGEITIMVDEFDLVQAIHTAPDMTVKSIAFMLRRIRNLEALVAQLTNEIAELRGI